MGRFVLDIFLEEAWIGVEMDGAPFHRGLSKQRRDSARDAWILENAGIPILRLTPDDLKDEARLEAAVRDFCEKHEASYNERRERGVWVL